MSDHRSIPPPPYFIDEAEPHVIAIARPEVKLPERSSDDLDRIRGTYLFEDRSFWPFAAVVVQTYASPGVLHGLFWPRLPWKESAAAGVSFTDARMQRPELQLLPPRILFWPDGMVRYDAAIYDDDPPRARTHRGRAVFHLDVVGALLRELALVAQHLSEQHEEFWWNLELQVDGIADRYGASYVHGRHDPDEFTPRFYPADGGRYQSTARASAEISSTRPRKPRRRSWAPCYVRWESRAVRSRCRRHGPPAD